MSAVITTTERQLQEPVRTLPSNPMEMLARAVERGATVEQLQQLMDLQDRFEANQARKAFVAAMAAFKANPPEIVKDKHVDYTTKTGHRVKYDHATLGAVCASIIEGLAKVGISHSWDVRQDQYVEVTCVLTHELGHSERVTLKASPDDSGGKNLIQALGSTVTYLQRYTLFSATGLAAMQDDDDGNGTGERKPEPRPGEKVNPRPDVSRVDQVRAQQIFTSIVDILAQDIDEKDKALDLVDIHEQLRTDDAMYSLIADRLAKEGIINKSGFKALIKLGLEESRKDLRL